MGPIVDCQSGQEATESDLLYHLTNAMTKTVLHLLLLHRMAILHILYNMKNAKTAHWALSLRLKSVLKCVNV